MLVRRLSAPLQQPCCSGMVLYVIDLDELNTEDGHIRLSGRTRRCFSTWSAFIFRRGGLGMAWFTRVCDGRRLVSMHGRSTNDRHFPSCHANHMIGSPGCAEQDRLKSCKGFRGKRGTHEEALCTIDGFTGTWPKDVDARDVLAKKQKTWGFSVDLAALSREARPWHTNEPFGW